MNHSQLRAFHAVANHGSFTAAADKLHVSQPTISEQVRALEDHYQIKLFERNGRQIALTGLGRALLDISHDLFALETRAEDLLTAARGLLSGELRVEAPDNTASGAMLSHPAGWAALALGVGGLLAWRWRRRSKGGA